MSAAALALAPALAVALALAREAHAERRQGNRQADAAVETIGPPPIPRASTEAILREVFAITTGLNNNLHEKSLHSVLTLLTQLLTQFSQFPAEAFCGRTTITTIL